MTKVRKYQGKTLPPRAASNRLQLGVIDRSSPLNQARLSDHPGRRVADLGLLRDTPYSAKPKNIWTKASTVQIVLYSRSHNRGTGIRSANSRSDCLIATFPMAAKSRGKMSERRGVSHKHRSAALRFQPDRNSRLAPPAKKTTSTPRDRGVRWSAKSGTIFPLTIYRIRQTSAKLSLTYSSRRSLIVTAVPYSR